MSAIRKISFFITQNDQIQINRLESSITNIIIYEFCKVLLVKLIPTNQIRGN